MSARSICGLERIARAISESSRNTDGSNASGTVPTAALGSRFTPTVPGEITAADSSLTFWASKDGDDVRSLLTRETRGFVVWMDEGDVAGQTMDVYPVQVTSQAKVRELDQAAQIMAQFAITSEPAENVEIPA